jgi:hypothetical protein
MAQLKRETARRRRTMSELVETALRMLFRSSLATVSWRMSRLARAPTSPRGCLVYQTGALV